jgi:hypothetical protein
MGKKKPRTPEQLRRRMRRKVRVADARQWLATLQETGTDIRAAYERWYGVDRLCTVIELRMLSVPISDEEITQARNVIEQRRILCAAKRAEKKRGKKQRAKEKRAAKQRAAAMRAAENAAAKRAAKQRAAATSACFDDLYRYAELDQWIWNGVDDDDVPVRHDASLDAGWEAVTEVTPETCGGYGARSIESYLLEDMHAPDLTVIEKVETKIERRGEVTVNVRIILEGDPEVLSNRAWALIFAIGTFSFDDADADADIDFVEVDEWTAGDMLRCLSFDRGRLHFYADHVRGRRMQTTVEINREGTIALETVNRGQAATRWISKLQDNKVMPVTEDREDDDSLDPLPF